MISKKPASSKRVCLPGIPDFARDFRKDWQRLSPLSRLQERGRGRGCYSLPLSIGFAAANANFYAPISAFERRPGALPPFPPTPLNEGGIPGFSGGEWISNRETSCD
jgi:hypothetical protein